MWCGLQVCLVGVITDNEFTVPVFLYLLCYIMQTLMIHMFMGVIVKLLVYNGMNWYLSKQHLRRYLIHNVFALISSSEKL